MQLSAVAAARKPDVEVTSPYCVKVMLYAVKKNYYLCFGNADMIGKSVGCGER
jgi:hypothetical protein